MPVIYRPARTEDLQRAGELVVHSLNELCERHGFGPIAMVRPPTFSQFSLRDDPNGLWVAEEVDQIRGFAFSWVAGELWFLAQLFVSPGHQARGIGRELLKRAFEHAIKAKTAVKALITPAFNSVSQGLYIQHGLFPRFPIYSISAEREELIKGYRERPCIASHLKTIPITLIISRKSMLALWVYPARSIAGSSSMTPRRAACCSTRRMSASAMRTLP